MRHMMNQVTVDGGVADRSFAAQGYQPGTAQTDFQINVTVTSSSNASTSSQVWRPTHVAVQVHLMGLES